MLLKLESFHELGPRRQAELTFGARLAEEVSGKHVQLHLQTGAGPLNQANERFTLTRIVQGSEFIGV